MKGFIEFIQEQGVVGLAIGLILGVAVANVVSGFVEGIINPLIGLILPNTNDLGEASFMILDSEIIWGALISPMIDLLVIAGVIYFVVRGIGLEKLDKKKDA